MRGCSALAFFPVPFSFFLAPFHFFYCPSLFQLVIKKLQRKSCEKCEYLHESFILYGEDEIKFLVTINFDVDSAASSSMIRCSEN